METTRFVGGTVWLKGSDKIAIIDSEHEIHWVILRKEWSVFQAGQLVWMEISGERLIDRKVHNILKWEDYDVSLSSTCDESS